jgi:hypothetical protein
MPDFEKKALMDFYKNANGILEFGSGSSTIYALRSRKIIYSVENDFNFYKALKKRISELGYDIKNKLIYANTGFTGKYGTPFFGRLTPGLQKKGFKYIFSGYGSTKSDNIDLIFVDGRWRIGCCLCSIFLFSNSVILLLDDYEINRNYNAVIDKYFIVTKVGRLAKLERKNEINMQELFIDFFNSLKNPG